MSYLPFPANSAEFEEYTAAMNETADWIVANTPDCPPLEFGEKMFAPYDDDSHVDFLSQDEEEA